MLLTADPVSVATERMTMRIVRADDATLPDDVAWMALAKQASEPNPFFEPWFLRPALAHLRDDQPVWIALAWRGEQLVGLYPLAVRPRYGRMPVAHIANWVHYQCFMGSPLVLSGAEADFWRLLIEEMDRQPWAKAFFSPSGLECDGPCHRGLNSAALTLGREASVVHRHDRALLHSALSSSDYLAAHVRPKKRKEWRRLGHRLDDLGGAKLVALEQADELTAWRDSFLSLEAAGWKGEHGAALTREAGTRDFFANMLDGAFATGRLRMLRLDIAGKPAAMLVNFLTQPGSWSFKIAHDPELARFSPGVLIELKNMELILDHKHAEWMDSCAVEGHPMIESLWAERRSIVQVTVPLKGVARRLIYTTCRSAESASAWVRARRKTRKVETA
jgi:Acetyltransferase (GNAT) domain